MDRETFDRYNDEDNKIAFRILAGYRDLRSNFIGMIKENGTIKIPEGKLNVVIASGVETITEIEYEDDDVLISGPEGVYSIKELPDDESEGIIFDIFNYIEAHL